VDNRSIDQTAVSNNLDRAALQYKHKVEPIVNFGTPWKSWQQGLRQLGVKEKSMWHYCSSSPAGLLYLSEILVNRLCTFH